MTDPTKGDVAPEMLPVTQADRDAAAALLDLRYGGWAPGTFWLRQGESDDDVLVQAFARHRLASAPAQPEVGEVPYRVQLSRKKGWRMPPNTVSVARPGPFGNPWSVGEGQVRLQTGETMQIGPVVTRAGAVDRFRRWHRGEFGFAIGPKFDHPLYGLVMCPGLPPQHGSLRGKNLACWCPLDQPCHADVLLELANKDPRP